jgi:hypothetical protein
LCSLRPDLHAGQTLVPADLPFGDRNELTAVEASRWKLMLAKASAVASLGKSTKCASGKCATVSGASDVGTRSASGSTGSGGGAAGTGGVGGVATGVISGRTS